MNNLIKYLIKRDFVSEFTYYHRISPRKVVHSRINLNNKYFIYNNIIVMFNLLCSTINQRFIV